MSNIFSKYNQYMTLYNDKQDANGKQIKGTDGAVLYHKTYISRVFINSQYGIRAREGGVANAADIKIIISFRYSVFENNKKYSPSFEYRKMIEEQQDKYFSVESTNNLLVLSKSSIELNDANVTMEATLKKYFSIYKITGIADEKDVNGDYSKLIIMAISV